MGLLNRLDLKDQKQVLNSNSERDFGNKTMCNTVSEELGVSQTDSNITYVIWGCLHL